MRHFARHGNERVDAAKRDRDTPNVGTLHNPLGELNVARLEREHGAGAPRLLPVQVVLRVRAQSRVAHLEPSRLQKVGNDLCVPLLFLHADAQRLEPALQQPALKGCQATAAGIDHEKQAVANLVVAHHNGAGHEVVVARKVLGARLVHNISPKLEGRHEKRRQHSVVHHHKRIWGRIVHHFGQGSDVGNLNQRVGWRLKQNHGRFGRGNCTHGLHVGRVNVVRRDAAAGCKVLDETVGAAVKIVAGNDLVAGLEQPRDHVECSHARGDHERADSARRDAREVALQVRPRRVTAPRVIVLAHVRKRVLLKSGGLIQRHAGGLELVIMLSENELGVN